MDTQKQRLYAQPRKRENKDFQKCCPTQTAVEPPAATTSLPPQRMLGPRPMVRQSRRLHHIALQPIKEHTDRPYCEYTLVIHTSQSLGHTRTRTQGAYGHGAHTRQQRQQQQQQQQEGAPPPAVAAGRIGACAKLRRQRLGTQRQVGRVVDESWPWWRTRTHTHTSVRQPRATQRDAAWCDGNDAACAQSRWCTYQCARCTSARRASSRRWRLNAPACRRRCREVLLTARLRVKGSRPWKQLHSKGHIGERMPYL